MNSSKSFLPGWSFLVKSKIMNKIDYSVEYSWKFGNQLITLVILCDVSEDNDLIGITDEIYYSHKKDYDDVEAIYFKTRSAATDYVYVKVVEEKTEHPCSPDLGCVGHLVNGKLTGYMSPPKLLKTYHNKPSIKKIT